MTRATKRWNSVMEALALAVVALTGLGVAEAQQVAT